MSNSNFKMKSDDHLLPLHWWENYSVDFLREFPRQCQLEIVNLLSRFFLVWRCTGDFEPDTGWLQEMEALHKLAVKLPEPPQDIRPTPKN